MQRKRLFTFFEMMVVAAILLLVSLLALPRLSKIPQRIMRENALSAIRNAMTEAGIRARANGKAVELLLDLENSQFIIQNPEGNLDASRVGSPPFPRARRCNSSSPSSSPRTTPFPLPTSLNGYQKKQAWIHWNPSSFPFSRTAKPQAPPFDSSLETYTMNLAWTN